MMENKMDNKMIGTHPFDLFQEGQDEYEARAPAEWDADKKRKLSKFQKKAFLNLHRIVAKERVVPRTTARSYSGIRFNKKKMFLKIMLLNQNLITLRTKKKEKGAVTRTMAKERR